MKTVLLLTYTTSPYLGSEASVSWNYILRMSKHYRLVVIYAMGYADVERYVAENGPVKNVVFHNIPIPSQTYNGLWDDIKYNYRQHRWHIRALERARQLCEQYDIDVVHYLNPIGFRTAGRLWKLDKPYVWGPISGVHTSPLKLWKAQSFKGLINTFARIIVHNAILYTDPYVHRAVKRADVLFTATPISQKQFERIHHKKSIYLPENGIVEMNVKKPVCVAPGEKIRIIWAGRIDSNKALILPLEALVQLSPQYRGGVELHVVGDGSLRTKMEEFCRCHGIAEQVIFHGKVDRKEVLRLFARSHLHIISSLCDATTTVLFEAMAFGVPTMTLDHCGMAGVVCDKCGIKIPIGSYDRTIESMKNAIERIIDDPSIINRLSQGVLECAEWFMWDNRIEIFDKAFEEAIKVHNAKGK